MWPTFCGNFQLFVASFDVLMQNFYKVSLGNNEKVPSFAKRLEGTLKPNKVTMLWEDDRPWGPTAPEGPPLSWGP